MKLSVLNQNNYKSLYEQVGSVAGNQLNQTVPTQVGVQTSEPIIPSTASQTNEKKAAEALKATTLAHAPMPYKYVGEIKLPFSENAKLYKMDNGQKVVILHKKGPTVLKSYYNVGSMNERQNMEGISHFIEHMAFNGTTDGLEAGEFFKIVNGMGAITNASTSFAQTDYYITSHLIDEKDWDTSVSIQSKMLQSPAHTAEMVEKEKGPVTSEISMVGDRPESAAINSCIKNLFQIQTEAPDLIAGSISNIKNLTREDTLGYYNLWYTPDNCTTVVTGEIDEKTAMDTIAKYFNKYKNPAVENRKYQEFKPIENPVRVDLKDSKAQSSTIIMGFKGPKNSDVKENIIMELLISSLMGYKGGRLANTLTKKQAAFSSNIERIGNRPDDPKVLILGSQTTPDKTEEIIKTIYDEINGLIQNPLTQSELEIGKKYLQMAYSQISEDSHMLNTLIGNALLDNNTDYISNYLPILNSITPQDMTDFIKKYFDLGKVSLSVVHPQSVDNNTIMANYQKANNPVKMQMPIQGIPHAASFKGRINEKSLDTSKIKQYKLANNMEVIFNPNISNIACGKVTFKTASPANVKPALPLVLSVMLTEGSKNKTYKTFYDPIYKSGIDLGFDVGFSSISATFQSLSQDINQSMDALKEVLTSPRLTEQTLDFAKKTVEASLKNADDTAIEFAMEKMFPNRPQAATKETALASLNSITLADVQGFYNYLIQNSCAKAVVTAPFESNPQLENNAIKNLSTGFNTFKPFENSHFQFYKNLEKNVITTKTVSGKQADIVRCFHFKTNYNPKDQVVFSLLNTVLGDGSFSRLFNDLREKQQLAYRVESNLDFVGDTGIIALGIKTTTDDKSANAISYDNVEKSLNGFEKHIQRLMTEKVSEEELAGAKKRMTTKILGVIESSASQTAILSDLKDTAAGILTLGEKLKLIESVTPEDIMNAAKYVFARPSVTSVVASEDTFKNINLKQYE